MKRKKLIALIFVLITLVSALYIGNYWYYYKINSFYVGNGIMLNIIAFISNLLMGVFGFREVRKWEKDGSSWVIFVFSPIWVAMLVVLLKNYGVSVDGYVAWLNIGLTAIHYLQLLLYVLFLCIPTGIDGLIKKKFKYEEIIFSAVSFTNTLLMMFSKDIQGMLWCSMFSLFYYIYMKRISIMAIGAVVIPIVCGVLCGVWDKGSLIVYKEVIDKEAYGYAYRYSLISMKEAFSSLAVFSVMIIYIIIGALLWRYIKMYVTDEYKKKSRYLFVVMSGMWIINIFQEFVPLNTFLHGDLAFSKSAGFFWLVPIIMILSMGQDDTGKRVAF